MKAGPLVALFHLLLCSMAPQCDTGLLSITNPLLRFPNLRRCRRGLSSPRCHPVGKTTRSRTSLQATLSVAGMGRMLTDEQRELKPPFVATQTRREYQRERTQEKNTNPGRPTIFRAGEEKHLNVTVGQRDKSILVKSGGQTKVASLTTYNCQRVYCPKLYPFLKSCDSLVYS